MRQRLAAGVHERARLAQQPQQVRARLAAVRPVLDDVEQIESVERVSHQRVDRSIRHALGQRVQPLQDRIFDPRLVHELFQPVLEREGTQFRHREVQRGVPVRGIGDVRQRVPRDLHSAAI